MEVGDALVRFDHRECWSGRQFGVDGGPDLRAVGERGQSVEDRAEAVVGGEAGVGELGAIRRKDTRQESAHDVPEDDWVRHLHHRRLEVQRKEDRLVLRTLDLRGEEGVQGSDPKHGRVDDLTLEDGQGRLEHGHVAVRPNVLDCQRVGLRQHH